MRKGTVLFIVCMIVMSTARALCAQPVMKAVEAEVPPKIDGDLSDACWQTLARTSDFFFLDASVPAPESTTAWLGYDQKYVYVAFDCRDSHPDMIRVQQTKRGGDLWNDDNVEMIIDPFSEFRNNSLCGFSVTAGGVQSHFVQSGTAKNEWAGDWDAAAKRNPDGYSVEMRIPFSILKYDQRNPRISVAFQRRHVRLDQQWIAPDLGKNCDLAKFYLWEGIRPPVIKPKPVVLAYSLVGTGGEDNPTSAGLDAKYQITPSLTGLLTFNPDFRNVEQQVGSVDFTYNERVLPDGRPFFQEASSYFPGSPLYYTRRIQKIDAGAKVVGKAGDYQLGFSNVRRFGHESYTVAEVSRQFGAQKDFSIWVGGVLSQVAGSDNLDAFATADYKWRRSERGAIDFHWTVINAEDSLGAGQGILSRFTVSNESVPDKLGVTIEREVVDADFNPYLGAGRDKGVEGWGTTLSLWDSPAEGPIRYREARLWIKKQDKLDGGHFATGIEPSYYIGWRNGRSLNLSYDDYDRPPNHDRTWGVFYGWNNNDLYRGGGVYCSFGNRVGGDYLYWSISQGMRLTNHLSAQVWTDFRRIGEPSAEAGTLRQMVLSAAYDIDPEHGIVGRLVTREGKSNLYFAYRQKVRAGLDAYLIYGDPNAEKTRSTVMLKLISPL